MRVKELISQLEKLNKEHYVFVQKGTKDLYPALLFSETEDVKHISASIVLDEANIFDGSKRVIARNIVVTALAEQNKMSVEQVERTVQVSEKLRIGIESQVENLLKTGKTKMPSGRELKL